MKLPFKTSKSRPAAPNRRRVKLDQTYRQPDKQANLFRRNRTITGSRSARIASASENDAQLQSPRAAAHMLHKKQRSLGLSLLGAAVVCSMLIVLIYQFTATVSVSIYGQVSALDTESKARYSSLIDDYLARHPAERLRWWLDDGKLVTYLQQRGATEVEKIYDIEPRSLGKTSISFKMREPVASWVIDDKMQYVDDSGTIFAKNYYQTPSVSIVDESGLKPSDASTVASSRFLSFIGQSVGQFRNFDLNPQRVIIPPDTTRQAQIELADEVRVKLSIDRPAGEQAEDAARAAKHLSSRDVSAEYVDVRVGGKAYYRVK